MMFSMEKCSGRNCTGTTEESELFAGGGEEMGKEGVPTDEVASAVAAVSDEIGDILKDELGDADRADRIGAELADLSAELGILAGLADGETQQHFPALFEIAMQASNSGTASSSSSSWSCGQKFRARRQARPRRPIGKGKEAARRRTNNRLWQARKCVPWTGSDASDNGDDDNDHWTDVSSQSSDSSSSKEVGNMLCNGCDGKSRDQPVSAAMGQLLLPLLCSESSPDRGHIVIRREDIVQLLASAEADIFRGEGEMVVDQNVEMLSSSTFDFEEPPVSPEEEAALLHYVCEAERSVEDVSEEKFHPVEEWLLGVYHSWCEFSALMFANSITDTVSSLKMNCRCRLCALTAFNSPALSQLILYSVVSLAHHAETIPLAVGIMRALKLCSSTGIQPAQWDMYRLHRLQVPAKAATLIQDQLTRVSQQGEMANLLVTKVCLCQEYNQPFDANHSVERFIKILENFKQPSYVMMKSDPKTGIQPIPGERVSRKVWSWYKQNTAYANPNSVGVWANYKHRCDCLSPRNWTGQHRKQLLGMSYECMMEALSDVNNMKARDANDGDDKVPNETKSEISGELQQGDGTGAKPPDNGDVESLSSKDEDGSDFSDAAADLDDISSSSSSLANLSLGGSRSALWRCVDRLVRSIASVERLMLCVLSHVNKTSVVDRKRVDLGLAEVDRKLMAMYRRLPEVHRRQLQVYKKQKKLSNVCMQLVGGSAPAPPAPASPPPAPSLHYQLQPIAEVRRKVMHMRDQQLYYHRLRIWLEDQLKQEKDSTTTDNNVTVVDDIPRRKKLNANRLSSTKRKLKPVSPSLSKPYKILQMLKQQAPFRFVDDGKYDSEEAKTEVEPPEAFPLNKDDNLSDTDTIVGEKETGQLCKEMKECLVKFANFALNNAEENEQKNDEVKYPEAVSPPLQEMSPTTPEPMPVYTPTPSQRLLSVTKLMNRPNIDFKDEKLDFQTQLPPDLNVPLNARRTPVLVNSETPALKTEYLFENCEEGDEKDPNIYKYMTFGMEIKKAMDYAYNSICKDEAEMEEKDNDSQEGPLSLEQICEVMMSLDRSSMEFLEKVDSEDPAEFSKLAELVGSMPQIIANMPDMANKLSCFATANEFPEFASIINSLPDANSEAQLTPETLKQIRELKHSKLRDNVKVTKNTAKRKNLRKVKLNVDNEVAAAFRNDIKDVSKDDKEATLNKDLLPFPIMSQVVIKKVYEDVIHNSKNSEIDNRVKYALQKSYIYTLFDNAVKSARNMRELRNLIESRFDAWKNYIMTKFSSIPLELLETELEALVDKFYTHIQDLAANYSEEDDKIMDKIDEYRRNNGEIPAESESFKEKLKQFTKELKTTDGNTFDLLIMNIPTMSQDNVDLLKRLNLKFPYILRRCTESPQLMNWIVKCPVKAFNALEELTNLPIETRTPAVDEDNMCPSVKIGYCIGRLFSINNKYMESLPKDSLTGDEWLVLLFRLEKIIEKFRELVCEAGTPSSPKKTKPVKNQTASEAEILAAKGLSKIIGQSSSKPMKKPIQEVKKPDNGDKNISTTTDEKVDVDSILSASKLKDEVILAQFESILKLRGDAELLESFRSFTQGPLLPESFKDQIKLIGTLIHANLSVDSDDSNKQSTLDVPPGLENIFPNTESLSKLTSDLLKQFRDHLLNTVGPEEEESKLVAVELPAEQPMPEVATQVEEPLPPVAVAVQPQLPQQQGQTQHHNHAHTHAHPQQSQHAFKGHNGGCAGESSSSEQPCTCCYCTVFGHAPPVTTPVPRNFNEARERLRSILNKKKQKCISRTEEPETLEKKPIIQPTPTNDNQVQAIQPPTQTTKPMLKPQPIAKPHPVLKPQAVVKQSVNRPQPMVRPPQIVLKPAPSSIPPALPRTQPPTLTPLQEKQKRQAMENHQKMVERMAKMSVNEKPEIRIKNVGELRDQEQQPEYLNFTSLPETPPSTPLPLPRPALHHNQVMNQQTYQNKPEPIYDLPIHNRTAEQETQTQKPTLTPQQMEQIQMQQRHLKMQQEKLEQELQMRGRQKQRNVSVSSRDTSVFSTSCDSSGESYWRENRSADPRSVDALLQYIEGPTRHVDRAKKRAKKQRQRKKKMAAKLEEERLELLCTLHCLQTNLASMKADLAQHKKALAQVKTSGKGKKKKQQQQAQEQINELTGLVNSIGKEVQDLEKQVQQCCRLLKECESQLAEARSLLSNGDTNHRQLQLEQAAMLQKQQQAQKQQLQQQQMQLLRAERQKQVDMFSAPNASNMVRVQRTANNQTLFTLLNNNNNISVNPCPAQTLNPQQQPVENKHASEDKKQTWEQALAHINQLAKSGKEKKKQKEQAAKVEAKKQKEAPKAPEPEPQPLSKKQRKLLAKQQAIEEEERRKKQELLEQQSKSKKEKKAEKQAAKQQENKSDKQTDKKAEVNKKTDKKQEKEVKKEEKKKESKVEKNAQQNQKNSKQTQPQQTPVVETKTKKERKKKNNNHSNNNSNNNNNVVPSVTMNGNAVDYDKGISNCLSDLDKPASCSIMEQLSCGVQVADLKLPPGITLTRVQPSEKKEPVPIKSVPVWKCSQLTATPTPVAKPPPVIHAELPPRHIVAVKEPQKTIIIPEPAPQPSGKSKKNKKKSKNKNPEQSEPPQDGTKMVTLRNPMFHPNLPSVQVSNSQAQKKQEQIRIPDPIPMPPNACQATITPTSNGMYTIRNPLMSMMHQQSLMGVRTPNPYGQQYNYVNPNTYHPVPPQPTHVIDPSRSSPKTQDEFQNRIMNLASFTQKNDEGYSLFQTPDDSQQRSFLTPEFYEQPKQNVSPNPIGTRPNNVNDSSLFANPIQRPEPIGTPLKREDDYSGNLYTPFGQEDKNVFRNALFSDKNEGVTGMNAYEDPSQNLVNGDFLPYFQRLRVGSKLNNEVTIHHVTESKFYKQDGQPDPQNAGMFVRGGPPNVWTNSEECSPPQHNIMDPNMYATMDPSVQANQVPPALEACDREMEAFKRFEYLFERRK